MADLYRTHPVWFEANLNMANEDELQDLVYRYELLLDPRNFAVFFFGAGVKLIAQEYKFLKAILNRNGERINAEKIMKQIQSRCKPEDMQKLSYRIKSKIKNKLKVVSPRRLPAPDEVDWILIDRNWETNRDEYTQLHYQHFDFNQYFDMLIRVKDGYYYTDFINVKILLQSTKSNS
jgi:hypothetical protein